MTPSSSKTKRTHGSEVVFIFLCSGRHRLHHSIAHRCPLPRDLNGGGEEEEGNKDAVENRGIVAGVITPARIEDAQKLARECVRKQYKWC